MVSLHVELIGDEDVRVYAKSTQNLEAWENFIKGMELFNKYMKEDNAKAQEFFKAALELDPEYAAAMTYLAGTYMKGALFGWSDLPPKVSLKQAFELLQKVLKLDEHNAFAHAMLATFYVFQRQLEKAITEGERAITLNPNLAIGYARLAQAKFYYGRFDEVITLMKKNHRLNPNYLPMWLIYICRSYIFLGRYEEALEVAKQMEEHAAKGDLPPALPPMHFSWIYQELGNEKEARAYMAEALERNSNISLAASRMKSPFKNPAHLQRELDAYRKAGMPEKPPRPAP